MLLTRFFFRDELKILRRAENERLCYFYTLKSLLFVAISSNGCEHGHVASLPDLCLSIENTE